MGVLCTTYTWCICIYCVYIYIYIYIYISKYIYIYMWICILYIYIYMYKYICTNYVCIYSKTSVALQERHLFVGGAKGYTMTNGRTLKRLVNDYLLIKHGNPPHTEQRGSRSIRWSLCSIAWASQRRSLDDG